MKRLSPAYDEKLEQTIMSDFMTRWTFLADRDATYQTGFTLGQRLLSNSKIPRVIAAIGDLGAGKTSLAQGLARGIGVPEETYVNNPTSHFIKHITPSHAQIHRFSIISIYIDWVTKMNFFNSDLMNFLEMVSVTLSGLSERLLSWPKYPICDSAYTI